MSNKMKGLAVFRHHLRNWAFFDGHDNPSGNDKRATLVISEERVFTESEVRAMAMAAIRAIKRDMPTDASVGIASGNIAKTLYDAGIVLDPA